MKKIIQKIAVGVGVLFLGIFGNSVHSEAEIPEYACFKADDVIEEPAYKELTYSGAICNRVLYNSAKEQTAFTELTVTWSGVNNQEFQKNPAYFYQLVLTDLLQEQRSFNISSSNLENSLNNIQMKLKDRAEKIWYGQDVQEIVASSVSLSALQELYEGYLTAQEVQGYLEELKNMTTQENYWVGWLNAKLGDIQGVFDSIAALKSVNTSRIAVYKKMYSCTDNSLMKLALNNLISQYESQNDLIFDTAIKYGADKIVDGCMNYAKESTKAALASIGLSPLLGGYEFGKFISNNVFGADAISENYLIMKTTVEVEEVMQDAVEACEQDYLENKNPQTAANFLEGVDMLLSMAYYGVDASDAFVYATLEDNLAAFISKTFFPKEDDVTYADWQKVLNTQRNMIANWEKSFQFIYDSYHFIYVKNDRLDYNVTEAEKQEIISSVEYQTALEEARTPVIDEDMTLFMDMTYEGDLLITDGTVDLNGFTLTVKGDLLQEGGTLKVNGGTLNVGGEYGLYEEYENTSTGKVEKGIGGTLRMNNLNDQVIVNGDYITYAFNYNDTVLSAGTLIIKGDFNQLGDTWNAEFNPTDDLKIIFEGKEIPEVSFESTGYASFKNVEFRSGKVKLLGKITGFALKQDLEIVGDLPAFAGTFDLNDHKMTIPGDFYQPTGTIKVNGGTLEIKGDYKLYEEYENTSTGKVEKGIGGTLRMNNLDDQVIVNGDYITYAFNYNDTVLSAGTLIIKGDFNQLGDTWNAEFNPTDNLKIIFEGKEIPEVSFESTGYASFKNVEFRSGKVKLLGKITGFALKQDLEIVGDLPAFAGTFDLNDHKMTIPGDFYQPTGTIKVNGGTLEIKGDYKLYEEYENTSTGKVEKGIGGTLRMNNLDDQVIVNGDYITYAFNYNDTVLSAGTLIIKGDFNQLGDTWNAEFNPTDNLKIIFEGKEIPEVSFESTGYASFKNVEFRSGKVKLLGKITGFALKQDLEIVGDLPAFAGIFDLNGHKMTIPSDFYQPTGTMRINGGVLNVEGDYKLYGERTNSSTGILEQTTGGFLQMNSISDQVNVSGDYITYAGNASSSYLGAGTLTIKGDFQHLGNTFSPGDLFQIVFAEKAVPNVSFASSSGRFNKVEFKTGNVSMSGKITGFVLQHDLTVVGEMPAFTGTFDLNGHTMNIQESFTQPSGTFKVNRGTLNIAKDWNLCGIKINEMTDEEEIIQGGSVLMQNVKDKVNVGGNLTIYSSNSSDSLKAGTLTLGGNLEQYGGSYSFYATQLHKTILTGGASTEKPQIINFQNTNCRFQTLQLAKDRSYYQFNPDNCWQELVADEPLSIADAVLSLSAESFQYDGTEKKPEVTVVLGGSTLTADQDYTLVYENNTEVGTAKVTVTGIGLYQGTVEKEFTITCEHQWGESITKEPTCQEEGEKTITCEICGQTKTEKIEKADHQYGEWTVAKEPTKDTDGERKRACIWCGLEETEVIPALGWETVPDGTTVISEGAFQGNTTIREIILPDSLKEIQANAFENCGNLERVVLPEGVVAIGDGAFQNCPNLQEVVIPKTVTQIGTDAFKGCPNLIIFGEEGSFAQTYAEENGISFTVFQKNDLASCRWEVPGEFTYNGEEHRPEVKLFLAEKQLVQGIDYTVAYENNLNAGEAYINVTGIRTFQGVLKIPFAIQKAARPVQPEEMVTKLYTDAPFKLEKEGDGIFQYEVSDPQIAEVSSDGTVTIKAAGKTEIVIKEAETENYLEGESVVALTVNPAPIRVSEILAQDKVFDGTTKAVLVTDQVVFEGKKESDQLSVEAQGSFVDANAGTGKTVLISGIKLVGTQSGNYVLDTAGQQQDAKASITKAQSVYSGRTEFTGTVGQSLSEITSGSGLKVAEYVFDQVGSFTNQAIYCPDSRNYEPQKGIAITIQITCDSHTGGKADCMHRAVCEKCGQEYGETDPNGHQYTEVVTKPTCTEGGYTTYTCRICQTSYQGNETKPAGHQLKDGVCTVCGYMELPAVGTTVTVGSLKYKIVSSTDEKQEVEVTAPVKKNLTSIEIPSVVKISGGDYQVVSVASKAFQSCTNLKKVTIGANVRSIGSSAFAGCRKLTSISTKNVQEIGSSAFSGCSSLKKAVTGTALQKIGNNAFYNCKALTSMTIGRNVNSIGSKAFANCTKLRKAVIGSKVKKINTNTFYGCKSLTSVTIGNNVTSIGNGAFKNCSKLRKVTIPVKVKSIGKDAFRNSKNLKSIVIRGTALKSVGKNAFKGVNSRAVVKVPKKKLKAYQKLLKNKGLSKAAKISK